VEDRKDGDGEPGQENSARQSARLVQVWGVIRPTLQLVELGAEVGEHKALAWTTRALVVLGDTVLLASRTSRR
jgi:hypothetical protein